MQRIRWPKNYSPWAASSDSDSDSSLAASTSTTPAKRSVSPERPITGVYLFCVGDQFQPPLSPPSSPTATASTMALATVPQADAIFGTPPLALSERLGVPLLTRRLSAKPALALPHNAQFDNAAARALHVDPATGCAPPDWTHGVGTVLVVRADQQPLTKDLLARIVEFARLFTATACADAGGSFEAYATPQRFAAFCAAGPAEHPQQHQTQPTSFAIGSSLVASQLIGSSQVLSESWFDVGKSQVSV